MECDNPTCYTKAIWICECDDIKCNLCKGCFEYHQSHCKHKHNFKNLESHKVPQIKIKLQEITTHALEQIIYINKETLQTIKILENKKNLAILKLEKFISQMSKIIVQITNYNFDEAIDIISSSLNISSDNIDKYYENWKFNPPKIEFSSISRLIEKHFKYDFELNSVFKSQSNKDQPSPQQEPQRLRHSTSLKNSIQCERGHILSWNQNIVFETFEKSHKIIIKCDYCEIEFSRPCWHCSQCNYFLCEICGNRVGAQPKKIVCIKQHDLIFSPDICFYNDSKGNGCNFTCKKCSMIKKEPAWECRVCEYALCMVCANNNFGLPSKIEKPKCENGDLLIKVNKSDELSLSLNKKLQCNYCKFDINGVAYACRPCSYYVCSDCYNYLSCPQAGHPVLSCQQSHITRWVKKSDFLCNSCLTNKSQEHFSCKFCVINFCSDCSMILLKTMKTALKKSHGEQKHPINWTLIPKSIDNNDPMCTSCKKNLIVGMFHCNICIRSYCALCSDSSRSSKRSSNRFSISGMPERNN